MNEHKTYLGNTVLKLVSKTNTFERTTLLGMRPPTPVFQNSVAHSSKHGLKQQFETIDQTLSTQLSFDYLNYGLNC